MTANHRALDASDIALIEKVKGTPSLYDSSSPDFKFAYRKEQLWENVAATLGMSAVDARRRWTCLRDRYSRELKQMRLHPEKHEFGNNDFFRQMDFLRKFVRKRRERRRIDPKFKYDSWDGSNDGNTKGHIKSDMTTQSSDGIYDETQDQYDAKLEVTTTEEAEDGYHDFVEDGQINESYEEYVDPQCAESTSKYTVSAAAVSSVSISAQRHSTLAAVNNAGNNILPISFLSSASAAAASATSQGSSSNSINYAMSNTQQVANKLTTNQPPQKRTTSETSTPGACVNLTEPEDDYFCKTIGSYLRQLSRRHKIKAKVEMFQILEKYIELEESSEMYREERKG